MGFPCGGWGEPTLCSFPSQASLLSSFPSPSSLLQSSGGALRDAAFFFFFFEWLLQIQPRRGEIVAVCMCNGEGKQQRKKKCSKPSVVYRQVQTMTYFPAGKLLLEKTVPKPLLCMQLRFSRWTAAFSLDLGLPLPTKTPCGFTSKPATKQPRLPKEKGSSASKSNLCSLFYFNVYDAAIFKFTTAC